MKCVVLLLMILSQFQAHARENLLLKCLGAEERRFHLKKDTGPVYDLNQKLIAEMIQIPNAQVSSEWTRDICGRGHYSESWRLLELSIIQGKKMFVFSEVLSDMQKHVTEGMVDDYIESTREILLGFIAQIQTLSPTPDCLEKEIPELHKFFNDIKFLQEDVDMKDIFQSRDQKIFNRLKDYPKAFQRCKSRLRLKKKPRPSSTEAAKKS